jgi:histidinol-phosphate aminotransferase
MIRRALESIPAYVPGSAGDGSRPTLKLSSNESVRGPLPSVAAAAAHAVAAANRYPDMAATDVRTALAQWLSETSSLPLNIGNIAVGAGSSALIQQAIQATCDDGDEVIYAWRSFEAYPILTRVAGATPVEIPLDRNYRHDLRAMAAAVTDRTRLIIVCNPNNPTGTTVTRTELADFLDMLPDDVQVLLDEAYFEYVRNSSSPDGLSLLAMHPNLAVARTFSKAYGLAGVRLGYLAGRPEFIEAVNKVCIPFSVNAVAEAMGEACIAAGAELRARTDETVDQRGRLLDALPEDLQVPSQANFVWLPLGARASEFADRLAEAGVVTRCFAGDGVRITVTDAAETEALLTALERARVADFAQA